MTDSNNKRTLIGLMILLLLGSYGYTWLATRESREIEILRQEIIRNRDEIVQIKQKQDERTRIFPDFERRITELERRIK